MDKELLEFEAGLRCFRPRAAPVRLLAGIERELAAPAALSPRPHYKSAASWTSWRWANWAAAAALAGVMLLAARFWPGDVPPTPAEQGVSRGSPVATPFAGYKPIAVRRTVYGTDDEGLVTLDDGRLGRRIRSHFVDTVTWRNPQTNASLRWSIPREAVRVVPVNAN
ncbi:MAG TPA: hypothetical protein VGD81_17675 [Opitutaceae bacterium]